MVVWMSWLVTFDLVRWSRPANYSWNRRGWIILACSWWYLLLSRWLVARISSGLTSCGGMISYCGEVFNDPNECSICGGHGRESYLAFCGQASVYVCRNDQNIWSYATTIDESIRHRRYINYKIASNMIRHDTLHASQESVLRPTRGFLYTSLENPSNPSNP